MRFAVTVDPETWQEVRPPQRPAAEADLVREFLRDYPVGERSVFQEISRKKKRIARRLREYRFDAETMTGGKLVSFSEVASGNASASPEGLDFVYRIEHDGREYLVDDLYCTNPNCNCRAIHLMFGWYQPELKKLTDEFLVMLPLKGEPKVEERFHCTSDHAEAVASAWWEKWRDRTNVLTWRYHKVREIAVRSISSVAPLAGGGSPSERSTSVEARPGRNDPCPCGSGNKFKKCCGR